MYFFACNSELLGKLISLVVESGVREGRLGISCISGRPLCGS